jgi:hypothetical protein
MDEGQWLTCENPQRMLEFLRGRASNRKRRLFAVACCRLAWRQTTDGRAGEAMTLAERYADEAATAVELRAACAAAWEAAKAAWSFGRTAEGALARAAAAAAAPDRKYARSARIGLDPVLIGSRSIARDAVGGPRAQAQLLRDLFGNPFRPPPPIDPHWLTWEAGTVKRLAQAAYDERDLPAGTLDQDRLAVLADALEEAGCQDVQILGHLRSGGEHYRGCHILDTLLGKE